MFTVFLSLITVIIICCTIGAVLSPTDERLEGMVALSMIGFFVWANSWALFVIVHFISKYW